MATGRKIRKVCGFCGVKNTEGVNKMCDVFLFLAGWVFGFGAGTIVGYLIGILKEGRREE